MPELSVRVVSRLKVLVASGALTACAACNSLPALGRPVHGGNASVGASLSGGGAVPPVLPDDCGPAGALGFIVPECPLGVACFSRACQAHDACYASCGFARERCDLEFYEDLRAICTAVHRPPHPLFGSCLDLAYIYWQAVARFGEPFFEASQGSFCPDGSNESPWAMRRGTAAPEAPFEDADDDLLPDEWERAAGLSVMDPADALQDPDGDGRVNLQEFLFGTDPWRSDSP